MMIEKLCNWDLNIDRMGWPDNPEGTTYRPTKHNMSKVIRKLNELIAAHNARIAQEGKEAPHATKTEGPGAG